MPMINQINSMHGEVAYLFLLTIVEANPPDPNNPLVLHVVNNLEPVESARHQVRSLSLSR